MKSVTFIAVAAALVLLVAGTVGVYAYDSAREDEVAKGVRVGGVDVGGLDRERARAKLRDELVRPLGEPVIIRARGRSYRLTGREAHLRADLDAMVDEAIRESRGGNLLSRTARGLTGGELDADIEPRVSYSRAAVQRHVDLVRIKTDRPPRDARIDFSAATLKRVSARDGFRVDTRQLKAAIQKALVQPAQDDRVVGVRLVRTKPKVTTAELKDKYDTVLTVDRGGFTLRLFKRLKLVKRYPIAVGQAGLETPAGLYNVLNMAVIPAWSVPNSAWAGSLAGQVIPGGTPQNPLKARWMGIYDGAGIHGTDATGSIGTNASHGCIRMLIPDVIELYDRVPVGAPVYIA